MDRPIPTMTGLWAKIENLFQPFPPPLHKGELLLEIQKLASRGWVTTVDGTRLVSRSYAGHVELQDQILQLREGPWSVEKAFLVLQVGFFYLAGRVELAPSVAQFIRERMSEPANYHRLTEKVEQTSLFEERIHAIPQY